MSGQLPFKGQIPFELGRVICRVEPLPLGQLVPKLARHVEQAVCRALAKLPERRFANVRLFLHALENPALLPGDTLGQVQPALNADDSTWVHQEDLAVQPVARTSDVLQTVQYSADELLALASELMSGTGNVPQVITEDLPTKPYVVTEAELRCLAERPASRAAEVLFAPSLPIPTTPLDAASAASLSPAESSLPSAVEPARENTHYAANRATCSPSAATEPGPDLPAVWQLGPQVSAVANDRIDTAASSPLIFSQLARPRRTPWLTIGAGSALFCLGFLMALMWNTRRPSLQHGHVYNAWHEVSAFATLYEPAAGNRDESRAQKSRLLHPAS